MNTKKRKELTADDVWAMLADTANTIKVLREDTAKAQAKTGRYIEKLGKRIDNNAVAQAETDKQMKRTDEKLDKLCEQIGGLSNNAGFHAEQFFQDTLAETLTFGGEKYDYMLPNLKYLGKKEGGEFDIVLVNGKNIAIIEAKNRIHPNDVKVLTEKKIAAFRRFFPFYESHKVYLGLAGFSFSKKVIENAKQHGVGIIKQVGKSIEIEADKLKAY